MLNTLLWCWPLLALALLKPLLRTAPLQRRLRRAMGGIAAAWIAGNGLWMRHLGRCQVASRARWPAARTTAAW